jgi:uracil-DNA glycosylase
MVPIMSDASSSCLLLEQLYQQCQQCIRCSLAASGRQQVVFASGNPKAKLMLVGEAPGQIEDNMGLPFMGRSGQLLTQLLHQVGLNRETDCYVCNVVKCRPPANRKPTKLEVLACGPFLQQQIQAVKPAIIVLVGATALQAVLGLKAPISSIRGQWLPTTFSGITAMAIFHPAFLLRHAGVQTGSPKNLTLDDLRKVQQALQYGPKQSDCNEI